MWPCTHVNLIHSRSVLLQLSIPAPYPTNSHMAPIFVALQFHESAIITCIEINEHCVHQNIMNHNLTMDWSGVECKIAHNHFEQDSKTFKVCVIAVRQVLSMKSIHAWCQGDVKGSLEDYDAASAADAGIRPYLWQRGISAYYAGAPSCGSRVFGFI